MTRPLHLLFVLCVAVVFCGTGCNYFRTRGSGTHYDSAPSHPHDPKRNKVREMTVRVTTDANGNVSEVTFIHSSGSDGVDGLAAQDVRNGGPYRPSMRFVASLTYSGDTGFTPPKLISSEPAP